MASFIRGKQAGVQKDLSAGIQPGHFCPDEQSRYGINSQIRHVEFSRAAPASRLNDIRETD